LHYMSYYILWFHFHEIRTVIKEKALLTVSSMGNGQKHIWQR